MEDQATKQTAPDPTIPQSLSFHIMGADTKEKGEEFANIVAAHINELSRYINVSDLDGVTIAKDYAKALEELDRGFDTPNKLTPSDGDVVGIAMTPKVLRDGKVKSHIVLSWPYAEALCRLESEDWMLSFNTLAHECAHVEITHCIDTAFPGLLLQRKFGSFRDSYRWEVILACFEEYAATRLSAPIGADSTKAFEESFLFALQHTVRKANAEIRAYRIHGQIDKILYAVGGLYGDLLKLAAYHLGNIDGLGLSFNSLPRTQDALLGHWFEPHFDQLRDICREIMDDYGRWDDTRKFERLGALAEKVLAEGGIFLIDNADGSLRVDIPFTVETLPLGAD